MSSSPILPFAMAKAYADKKFTEAAEEVVISDNQPEADHTKIWIDRNADDDPIDSINERLSAIEEDLAAIKEIVLV